MRHIYFIMMFYSIIVITALQLTSTRAQAEEITINCDGKIYKYRKSFWSDPTVAIRNSAQWKPYCEKGEAKIYDKGVVCKADYEYTVPVNETRTHSSETVRDKEKKLRDNWKLWNKCQKKENYNLNTFKYCLMALPRDEYFSPMSEYVKKNTPIVGSPYVVKTADRLIQTEFVYVLDFYLVKLSRTIADGSTSDWSTKCELMPN
jgi:hypothetical protein